MDVFSASELKAKLIDKLQTSGISDSLKSQLRAKLYSELKLRVVRALPVTKKDWLMGSVVNTLLIGYLRHRDLHFTLSVFLPESGMNENLLTDTDILRALRLDGPHYTSKLSPEKNNESCLLMRLLNISSETHEHQTLNQEIQTYIDFDDLISKFDVILAYKLRDIEGCAKLNMDKSKLLALEERMTGFQHQVEKRAQDQLETMVLEI